MQKVVKTKIKTDDMRELNGMFDRLLNGEGDIDVVIEKREKLLKLFHKVGVLLSIISRHNPLGPIGGLEGMREIRKFSSLITTFDVEEKNIKFDIKDYYSKNMDENTYKTITESYKKMKNSEYTKQLIITAHRMESIKKHIKEEKLKEYIDTTPVLSFKPFSFSSMNFKMNWHLFSESEKKIVVSVLEKMYYICLDIYEIVMTPDINISQFSELLVESIQKVKKQLPRCEEAFKLIENSVNLLKNNFTSYYKESVKCKNPSIIMENFILDVSKKTDSNLKVMSQFKKIYSHLKKKTGNIPKTAEMDKLFDIINNQFQSYQETKEDETGVQNVDLKE